MPELIFTPNIHDKENWIIMSMNHDGTLGYTSSSYAFVPSPIYDDSLGFVIEYSEAGTRLFCYNVNYIIFDYRDRRAKSYIQLAEIYNSGFTSIMNPGGWNISERERADAISKWQQIISPAWMEPVIMISEAEWLAYNFLYQQASELQQTSAYYAYQAQLASQQAAMDTSPTAQQQFFQSYTAEAVQFKPEPAAAVTVPEDMPTHEVGGTTETESVPKAAPGPAAPAPAPAPIAAAAPELDHSRITKEMRAKSNALLEKLLKQSFRNLLSKPDLHMDNIFWLCKSNDFIKNASEDKVLNVFSEVKMPLNVCLNLLGRKKVRLSKKVIRALFRLLLTYPAEQFNDLQIPGRIINIAYANLMPDGKDVIDNIRKLHAASRKKTVAAPDSEPVKPTPKDEPSTVAPTVAPKPLTTVSLAYIAIATLNATDFNAEYKKSEKHRIKCISELKKALKSPTDLPALHAFLSKLEPIVEIWERLLVSMEQEDYVQTDASTLHWFITRSFELDDHAFYFHITKSLRHPPFLKYLQQQKLAAAEIFEQLETKSHDAKLATLEILAEKIKQNAPGTLKLLRSGDYADLFTAATPEGKTLLMLALESPTTSIEIIELLCTKAGKTALWVDNLSRNILHYWALHKPNNIKIFTLLLTSYMDAYKADLDRKTRLKLKHQNSLIFIDNKGLVFIHYLFASENPSSHIIKQVLQTVFSKDDYLFIALPCCFAKTPEGNNLYNLMETKSGDFTEAMDLIKSFTLKIAAIDQRDAAEVFDDYFNVYGNNVALRTLDAKASAGDERSYEKMKVVLINRLRFRKQIYATNGNFDIICNHDFIDTIYGAIMLSNERPKEVRSDTGGSILYQYFDSVVAKDKIKINAKIKVLVKICIESEVAAEYCNLSIVIISDMVRKHIPFELGFALLKLIFELATPLERDQIMNFHNVQGEDSLTYVILAFDSLPQPEARKLLEIFVEGKKSFTGKLITGDNILHLALKVFAIGAMAADDLKLLVSHIPVAERKKLIDQPNKADCRPRDLIRDRTTLAVLEDLPYSGSARPGTPGRPALTDA